MARNRMVVRTSAPFRGRSGHKRSTQWFASADISAFGALAGGGLLLEQTLPEATLLQIIPGTVVRTVGHVLVVSDQVAAAEQPFGAMGMAVVSEQARALGITALPSPIIEEASDLWFVYQPWAAQGGTINGAPLQVFEFDSRAQRKIEDGMGIVVVYESASAAGIGALVLTKFRMLFKLH